MARARLLLGSTPYIISTLGKQSGTVDGVSAANTSTTQGVRLALADSGEDQFRWGWTDTPDRTQFTVVIAVDGEGTASNFFTRYATVKALLDSRFSSLRLQYDTDLDAIDGRLSAGGYSSWTCEYDTVGSVFGGGCCIIARFTGEKAIKGAGIGSSGTAENPTGLEDQITYSILQDERGISGVYARAIVHGTAGTAYTGAAGAHLRLRAWFDLIKATPPSFVPTGARFVPGTIQVGSQNEEAVGDCQWLTSSAQSGVDSMSAGVTATQWELRRSPRRMDTRAGEPGEEVEIIVKIVYAADANTNSMTATAPTPPSQDTVISDVEAGIAAALSQCGIGEILYTQPLEIARASSGSETVGRAVGLSGGGGVLSYDVTIVDDSTFDGEIVTLAGAKDIPAGVGGMIDIRRIAYNITYMGAAPLVPTLGGGYLEIGKTVPLPVTTTATDGQTETTIEGVFVGRKLRNGGAVAGAAAGGGGQGVATNLDAAITDALRG